MLREEEDIDEFIRSLGDNSSSVVNEKMTNMNKKINEWKDTAMWLRLLMSQVSLRAVSFLHSFPLTRERDLSVVMLYAWFEDDDFVLLSPYLSFEHQTMNKDSLFFSNNNCYSTMFTEIKDVKWPGLRFLESGEYDIDIFFQYRGGAVPELGIYMQYTRTIVYVGDNKIDKLSMDDIEGRQQVCHADYTQGIKWQEWHKRSVLRIEAHQRLFVITTFGTEESPDNIRLYKNNFSSFPCPFVKLRVERV